MTGEPGWRHLLLTDAERERFAAYLEHEAATDEGIVTQMENIHVPEAMIRRVRAEAAAARMVAAKLRAAETQTISGRQP
jgi:hypothetical protein